MNCFFLSGWPVKVRSTFSKDGAFAVGCHDRKPLHAASGLKKTSITTILKTREKNKK